MNRNDILKYTIIFVSVLLITLICLNLFRENNGQFPEIPKSFSSWIIKEPVKFYKGKEIFDFINGEGEIYLEYDFKTAAVQQYFSDNNNIELVVYNMGKGEDAFGIFSLYRSEKGETTGIGNDDRTTDFSIKFWKDKYFVNIMSYNAATRNAIMSLAKIIEENIPNKGEKPEILKYFSEFNQRSVIYFHGRFSLNSIYYIADENALQLNKNTDGIICNYTEDGKKMLLVKYPDEKSATNALEALKKYVINESVEEDDNFLIWKRAEKNFDIFMLKNNYLVGILSGSEDSIKHLSEFFDNTDLDVD